MNKEQERGFEQWVEIHRGKDLTADKLSKYITTLLNNEREEIAKEIERGKEKMLGYNHPYDIIYRAATITLSSSKTRFRKRQFLRH